MKFWGNFIDIVKQILEQCKQISTLLLKQSSDKTYRANSDPIKNIKTEPIMVLKTDETRKNIIIQNIGIEPCFIKLGQDISADDFHCILASDTLEKQGNGGSIKLENWHGEIWAICEKETKLSILEY